MKVVILVDALMNKGGIERIVLEQSKYFDADIIAGKYYSESTFSEFKKMRIKTLISSKNHSFLDTLKIWVLFNFVDCKKYDLIIFHGMSALNSASKNQHNIWYCHSPSRYLYDLYEEEYKKQKGIKKIIFSIITSIFRFKDRFNVKNIDRIFVNSNNTKKRVKKYYDRDSKIVYPFVDTKKFKFVKKGDFFLSTSRLDKIKRVDLIIRAFLKMPNKKLVIASSGVEESNLIKQAKNMKNIIFTGSISDKKLQKLYGSCISNICFSYKEDFGMVAIESMSAGKPCIAVNDNGFKETIIHKKTGYLINNPQSLSQIKNAISWVEKNLENMKEKCEKRAECFSLTKMKEEMKTWTSY